MRRSVAIVGAGRVGATTAFTLLTSGLVESLLLIDSDESKAEGEALDLRDGLSLLRPADIRYGDFAQCREASIVIITAGAAQRGNQSRMSLLRENTGIFREIIPAVLEHNRKAILLIVTNPVDVLTYLTIKLSGLPPSRVIGTGTVLDTARLRYQISAHCRIDPRNVHAYVIGGHGEGAVPVWSAVQIAGMRLGNFCRFCGKGCTAQQEISDKVRYAADEIIQRKGATNFAIALSINKIVESILKDENTVLTVSTLVDNYYGLSDLCFSLPVMVNSEGAAKILPLELEQKEVSALQEAVAPLQKAREELLPAVAGR